MTPRDDPALRRRRRAVLRAHHPDLGGDAAELIRQLHALNQAPPATGGVVFVRQPRGLRRLTAWVRARYAARHRPSRVH